MIRPIRAAALLTLFALLFGLCACGRGSGTALPPPSSGVSSTVSSAVASAPSSSVVPVPAIQGKESLGLPVVLSKSLNPLTTDNMTNLVLWPLLYDSLAEPDQSYNPVMNLADSVNSNGLTVTAHLRSGVLFCDGSALTAKDVKYSYDLVKRTPTSFFYPNTLNIGWVEASGSSTVIFHLGQPDPLFANLLTVPIIKTGTDANNAKFSVTGINVPPTGTGRYVFTTNSVRGALVANTRWYKGKTPAFKTIDLVNILTGSATFAALQSGQINFLLTDTGSGGMPTAGLSTTVFPLNRLVFMGVNATRANLSSDAVRKALSLALDRKSLVSNVFSSRAAAANLPLNPAWKGLDKPSDEQLSPQLSAAQASLTSAGYTAAAGAAGFGLLVDGGDATLLAAAREITSNLAKIGITVRLDVQSSDAFNTKLAQGSYDLYLAQITLPDNMDLSAFFSPGGAASANQQNASSVASYTAWRGGAGNAAAFADAFLNETPFIPLCFRSGTVSYTKGLTGAFAPTFADLFGGIEDWHFPAQ